MKREMSSSVALATGIDPTVRPAPVSYTHLICIVYALNSSTEAVNIRVFYDFHTMILDLLELVSFLISNPLTFVLSSFLSGFLEDRLNIFR